MDEHMDLLEGVDAIAVFLGTSRRRAQYLIENRAIPCFKMTGRWYSRRSSLREHFATLEQECGAAAGEAVAG